ncbi:patatin-like phospholipase family protein [Atopomonas sediminilitoris]|uniref:patatin-like phospholipase family protein n=1 Tax=Atopomonas sediminilitoris TaxID=2919919 RepID=UPI001F4DF8E7|nr:patatin-like phospholipase family protein [Atopomonas sediminilitoris]MCJ8168807.1 patatin-like phospholipase family protein [Atopomonas sediminilitoris]
MLCRVILLIFLTALSVLPAQAREHRVGLVLSGGAARGLAHIGVLKALEEQGVRIHAIAGTSMGAVVGGLYAAGYSADELETLAIELNWGEVLSDQPPRRSVPYRRKQDDRDFLSKLRFPFRADGTLGLPLGVIQGQNLDLVLQSLLLHIPNNQSFDRLPIPFRAVATNIASGDMVVFDHGNLAIAIRASMSIPAAFSPLQLNGQLLVDGGMVNNVPIDVARAMDVDQVIAVDIGTPLASAAELDTVLDVMNQSITLMTRKNAQAQIATLHSERDLLLVPELNGMASVDFSQARFAMRAGYLAAQAASHTLASRFAHGEALPVITRNERRPRIDSIRIENNSAISDQVIRQHLRQPLGEPLNLAHLQSDLATLYGLEYFDRLQYRVDNTPQGNELVLEAHARRSGINYLNPGISLADDFNGGSSYTIGASFRINGINELGGEWLTRVRLGDEQELYSELYQPLDYGSRYFVAPYLHLERQNIDILDDLEPIAEYKVSTYATGINLGRQIGNNGEIRFGVGQEWGDARVRVGRDDFPNFDFEQGFYDLRYSYDSVDQVDFPTSGQELALHIRQYDPSLGADERYRQWLISTNVPFALSERSTLLLGGKYGRALDDRPAAQSNFQLGGLTELSGYQPDALSAQNISLARAVVYRRMSERSFLPLDFPLYFGGSLEVGRAWYNGQLGDSGYIQAGSVFMGYVTPFGPLVLGLGANDEDERALYMSLGRPF